MKKRFCDCCGNPANKSDIAMKMMFPVKHIGSIDGTQYEMKRYDLCFSCRDKIAEMLQDKGVVNWY